jgi:hypothetical protein
MTATQLHDIQQDRTSKNVLAPRLYLAMNVPFGHNARAAASPASEKGVKQEYAYDSTQAERYAAISVALVAGSVPATHPRLARYASKWKKRRCIKGRFRHAKRRPDPLEARPGFPWHY